MEQLIILRSRKDGYKKVELTPEKEKAILQILNETELKKTKRSSGVFRNRKKESVLELHPELKVYETYFKNNPCGKNAYIIILKQMVINYMVHLSKTSPISLQIMAEIVSMKDHATVLHHKNLPESKRHPNYIEVTQVADKMIKQEMYPVLLKNTANGARSQYEWKKL